MSTSFFPNDDDPMKMTNIFWLLEIWGKLT